MVRQTTLEDLEQDLIEQLISESSEDVRCPHFKHDKNGAYCGKDHLTGQEIIPMRRRICDSASLQLWCLDKERYSLCIWYKGEPFTK